MPTNVALNKPATASSYLAPYAASRAVNGVTDPASRWLCTQLPGWMSVDLGSKMWINRWVVRQMSTAGWSAPQYVMNSFSLQGSDNNSTWTTIASVTNNTSSVFDSTIAPVGFRYFRVYVTSGLNVNPKYASIVSFELYDAPPTSPYLSSLIVKDITTGNDVALNPAFNKTTGAYTASVANGVTRVDVTPIAEQPSSGDAYVQITVNGVAVQSGTSTGVDLAVGVNNISVVVTSAIGGLQQTYTLAVTRAASTTYMASLVLQKTDGTAINLVPAFDKNTQTYTANIDYNVSSIKVIATASSSSATVVVNGGQPVTSGQAVTVNNLVTGNNTVTAAVTGDAKTYTVTVNKAAGPYLTALVLLNGTNSTVIPLNPSFSSNTYSYSASTTALVVKVTPTAEDSTATITVKGTLVASGQTTGNIPLQSGLNQIPVVVKLANGAEQQYMLNITK